MNYRTVSVQVQAMQWLPLEEEKVAAVVSWLIFGGAQVAQVLGPDGANRLAIGRPGEQLYANRSDWVVLYASGAYRVCTEEEFASKYQREGL